MRNDRHPEETAPWRTCEKHYPPKHPGAHPPPLYGSCFACRLERMAPPAGVTFHVDKRSGDVIVIDPRVR